MKTSKKPDTITISNSTPTLVIIAVLALMLTGGVFYYAFHNLPTTPLAHYAPERLPGEFEVTVVTTGGNPLPESSVVHAMPGGDVARVSTDEQGKVRLTGIQGEEYTLTIEHPDHDVKTVSLYCCQDEYISLLDDIEEKTILRLHGSNTIGAKLAPAMAQGYLRHLGAANVRTSPTAKENEVVVSGTRKGEKLQIAIAAHGSSTGFKALAAGECDIGMASRKIKDKEIDLLAPLGDMTSIAAEHILALDGIAVIVHKSNPVKSLSVEQAAAIFNGEIRNWSRISGRDGEINVYSRDDRSGTYDTFKSLVLRKTKLVDKAKRFESNAKLSDEVAADEFGIGFTSLPNIRNAKPVAISDGALAILPTFFTVATEDYSLSRRLYLYLPPTSQNGHAKDFISFALNLDGQKIVEANNLVDLNIRTFVSRIAPEQPIQDRKTFEQYRKAVAQAKRLSLNFRFRRDGFELDNRGYRDLDRIVAYLKDTFDQDRHVVLIGFTDSEGDYTYNYNLALKRAQSVAAEFKVRGITFVDILSAAEEVPVATNETGAGQRKNRRVEVWLKAPQGGQLTSR